jgi:hypothetical protein
VATLHLRVRALLSNSLVIIPRRRIRVGPEAQALYIGAGALAAAFSLALASSIRTVGDIVPSLDPYFR